MYGRRRKGPGSPVLEKNKPEGVTFSDEDMGVGEYLLAVDQARRV